MEETQKKADQKCQPEKLYRINCMHPPIDFVEINKTADAMDYKTSEARRAFKSGWMAAMLSLTVHEFPDIDLLDK